MARARPPYFLNPGMLGSSELFRTRYAIPVEGHGQTEPAQRLRAITRPYVLRRLKTDPAIIDDLPEKIEVTPRCSPQSCWPSSSPSAGPAPASTSSAKR